MPSTLAIASIGLGGIEIDLLQQLEKHYCTLQSDWEELKYLGCVAT